MELDNMTYYDQGDYVNALKYYGKLLYIQEEILSENHYDIAITCNNMAGVFYKKGDYENAIEYYGKAIELVKHLKGMDNLELASWYNNMAFVLREQGKYDNALELYKKANAIFLSACGKNHPYVEDTQINIMIMETLITTGMTEDELMEMYYQNFGMDE
jgi:tetratricopeptide (TPR) repeat protein